MTDLTLIIATVKWPGWKTYASSWGENADKPFTQHVIPGLPLIEAYQQGFETTQEPIIGYVHDDCRPMQWGWDTRVLEEFKDPNVGLVGFGGALGHGDRDMYAKPFAVPSLARRTFLSNMTNAEEHGQRFAGSCDVAVLDGFAMFVRRKVLATSWMHNRPPEEAIPERIGWPQNTPIGYCGYDYWLCCETRRQGYRIRLAGVACEHLSGKSTGLGSENIDFVGAHKFIYDTCRDVLPYTVGE